MKNYSLNNLIAKLTDEIDSMEMKGLDIGDDHWNGEKEFEIEFEDCIAVVGCDIFKSFDRDKELTGFKVTVDSIHLQYPDDKKIIPVEDVRTIENSLKL